MDDNTSHFTQRQIAELYEQYDLLSEKIRHLRSDSAIETEAASHFKLQEQIKRAESERSKLEADIRRLEEKASGPVAVYISYSPIDCIEAFKRLSEELRANGIKVVNQEQLERKGADNLSNATHVVVCITTEVSQPSSRVRYEITAALQNRKKLIPLLFPGGRKPLPILTYDMIDFSNWAEGFANLLEHIRRPLPVATKPQSHRDAEVRYLQMIGEKYDHWRELYTELSLSGKVRQQKVRLKGAASRYLDMQHDIFKEISHEFEDDKSSIIRVQTFPELVTMIRSYNRVALVGDPGSGKTTTFERLAYELANMASTDESEPLPILVPLGAYRGDGFQEFVAKSFDDLDLQKYLPSRAFLLLDGLNEMAYEHWDDLDEWLRLHPETPVIVSCRRLEYIERRLPLQRVDICPMDVVRIHQFIHNYFEYNDAERLFWSLSGIQTHDAWEWFKLNNPQAAFADFWFGHVENVHSYEVEKLHLKHLQEALQRDGRLPGLLGLVSTPFLLFAAIQVFVVKEELPDNKGQLFEQFVELLLEHRAKVAVKPGRPWVNEDVQRRALAQLSYKMQEDKAGTSIDEERAIDIIGAALPGQDVDLILYFAENAGILERTKGTVRFTHQLLQEYFAADEMSEDIRRGVPATKYWPAEKWWEPTGWEETALLLAGLQGNSSSTVRWLAPVNPDLAFKCATETGTQCDAEALDLLYEPPPGNRVSPLARAEWGRMLAKKGDQRPGVGLRPDKLPDISWSEVPAGTFYMGGDKDVEILGIAWEGAEIVLPYNYLVSKYATTYAQFEPFVEDGYNCQKYWTKAGWRWKGSQKFPRFWNDPRYHISNHPVVGVTWYEAYAYTRWLDDVYHNRAISIPLRVEEWEIRLPTEAEWEKAARYPDARKYPWGNTYVPGYANIDETFENAECGPYALRRTTAVGMYPQGTSALGIFDLCGNVWEWCLSKWDVVYRYPEDTEPEGTDHRGVRGASWYNSVLFAPSAAHDCQDADLGVNDVGFRVVVSPRNVT